MSLVKLLDTKFLNSEYYRQALTHRSVSAQNNERLEYLGDSLLGFFIAEWLFNQFPSYPEGDLTRLRAHLVRKETLAEIARKQNLGELIALGAGELKSGGSRRDSILADALEALIGALYLSEGIESAKAFTLKLFAEHLQDIPTVDELKDPTGASERARYDDMEQQLRGAKAQTLIPACAAASRSTLS